MAEFFLENSIWASIILELELYLSWVERSMIARSYIVAVLALSTFVAAPVMAQSGGGEVKKIKYDFAPVVISGNVEKPQVQYFISREKIRDVTPLDLKESFLDRILKAVEKEPF